MLSFFRKTARRIIDGNVELDKIRPILEFLARGYSPAWLLMSELEEEVAGGLGVTRAAECVRRYIETQPPEVEASTAWTRLDHLYRISDEGIGGCSALLKASESTDEAEGDGEGTEGGETLEQR